MWSPNITTPAVRMLCHHGPVRSLAVDPDGRHMVTTGADGQARKARQAWTGQGMPLEAGFRSCRMPSRGTRSVNLAVHLDALGARSPR